MILAYIIPYCVSSITVYVILSIFAESVEWCEPVDWFNLEEGDL